MVDIALADLPAARRYARALARFACGGSKGRGKLDPVYVDVTQGRDSRPNWAHYSSCGDLLHWVSWTFGVRSEWVNRDDAATERKWTFGPRDNISTLQGRPGHPGPGIVTPADYLPEAGDFLLCWDDGGAHVHVRVAGNTDSGMVETFDYGAGGMSASEFPGATCNRSTLIADNGKLFLDSPGRPRRRVQKVVQLTEIISQSSAPTVGIPIEELEAKVP